MLTIQHVDHDASRIGVAWNAGVISAVTQPGLGHQEFASGTAFRLLGLKRHAAPKVNAEL